jgi:iron(III) transport system ATP-binding protein
VTPIRIQSVSKHFGTTRAVDQVSLDIEAGELFFLLGPSGCGKTTLLRMLAGFVQPDAGEIYFGDQPVTHLPARARDAGMVFQTYALWPHMTVAANVAYGLQVRGVKRADVGKRVEHVLKLVHMEGFGERKPNQLSGGQQQRVALARALVIEPRVFLLDEPLSNLDARLRDEMREEIRRLHKETGLTMVYVTHDQKEALTLADRLAVMQQGRLVQVGKPQEVYNQPANRFVAGFLGDTNLVPGVVRQLSDGQAVLETALGTLSANLTRYRPQPGTRVFCSLRPHSLAINPGGAAPNSFSASVQQVAYLGELLHIRVLAGGEQPLQVITLPQFAGGLHEGASITLAVNPDQVVVLPDTE